MIFLILLVGLGSNTFSLISGLTFRPKGSFVTTKNFSLVCELEETLTSSIIINDPVGNTAGSCGTIGCGSGFGNIMSTNNAKDSVTVEIIPANINIPSSEGNWTCSNGTDQSVLQVKIFSTTSPEVWTESTPPVTGSPVNVQIDCIYPYPDEIRIDYVEESTRAVLKSTIGPTFTNGIATNCIVTDTRAISMKGTFTLSGDKLNGAEVQIAAVVLVNGVVLDIGYSNFTFQSKGCKYSDAELILGGFSCFLIVVGITSIIMLIFLLCQMLPKIFEDKRTNKIIIIVVFNSFALIIGCALGFGLKECDKRDLGLGLGLGFGFILAIALVLTLYIYHKQCGSKKENEDENRFSLDSCFRKCQVKPEKEIKPENNPQRVGNKTDVLKGDQSALNQKVLHSPLPLPPVDNSQPSKASDDKLSRKKLDPIAVENEEANSSEKKKKKKKRKKKKIDNETADNNVEEAGDNGNLN